MKLKILSTGHDCDAYSYLDLNFLSEYIEVSIKDRVWFNLPQLGTFVREFRSKIE